MPIEGLRMLEENEVAGLTSEQQQYYDALMDAIHDGELSAETWEKYEDQELLPRQAMKEITKEYIRVLSETATIDPRSGLLNNRGLAYSLRSKLGKLVYKRDKGVSSLRNEVEEKNRRLAVLVIDIDKFKQYNDNYSHAVGDQVIEQFGKIINNRAREEDIKARSGGDEFLVIFDFDASQMGEDPEKVLEEVRQKYQHYLSGQEIEVEHEGKPIKLAVKASVGCEVFTPEQAREFVPVEHGRAIINEKNIGPITKKLTRQADEAMYEAKEERHNQEDLPLAA